MQFINTAKIYEWKIIMNFMINETEQKLRGGYYTPTDITDYIIQWIVENKAVSILEPSCGDGNFLSSINKLVKQKTKVKCIEFNEDELKKASCRVNNKLVQCNFENADFLQWSLDNVDGNEKYDAIVGNPPFIRYQYLPTEMQEKAKIIFEKFDLKFTKHTNIWVPFIISSVMMLKSGGLFGMVIPSEIFHVKHAAPLRKFLSTVCSKILIIDPQDLWFEDTLQGVVILMAEKKQTDREPFQGLAIVSVSGKSFLEENPTTLFNSDIYNKDINQDEKWTYALLSKKENSLLSDILSLPNIYTFKEIASVDIGIVTGANKFFLVPQAIVDEYKLEKWAYPMFGRSEHCSGVIYDHAQHEENKLKGHPTNFLWFNDEIIDESNSRVLEYIKLGEHEELHTRYKCGIRKPWYKVPSVYTTNIGMLKRAHHFPKLILNEINAYTTDTAYRIRSSSINAKDIVNAFVNSLTALSAELEGRHYGGGVLELVPSEIEKLRIPLPKQFNFDLEKLNLLIKEKDSIAVMNAQNNILHAVGLSPSDADTLLNAWVRLKNRRQRC